MGRGPRAGAAPHRFFVTSEAVRDGRAAVRGDQARQIASVLRLAAGERVVLVLDGDELEVRLDAVTPARVEGEITGRRACPAEPRIRLTLALPLLRGDRSEEVLEAVTQLGVSRVVPFTSERSVARGLSVDKRIRWERIARESAETARRGRLPEIAAVRKWPDLFAFLPAPAVVAWEGERERRLRDVIDEGISALSIVVGPEGGLTPEEVWLAREHRARVVSLGPRNLRSETAAIAAVAEVMALAGE